MAMQVPVIVTSRASAAVLSMLLYGVMASPASAGDNITDALTKGKVSLDLRYRYETVDQANALQDAKASTLRTALGYTTGTFYDFGAMLEFENVAVVGAESYNSTVNGETQYSTVVDPKGSEVNQGYLSYAGLSGTALQLGRQKLILDNARWVGNVGWRQNEQTFDGFTAVNQTLSDTKLTYAYIRNVNRIFGDDSPSGNAHMKSNLFNADYNGLGFGTLTVYAYLLDYNTAPGSSTQTLGARFAGKQALTADLTLLYTAEYARQSDYADNPASYNDNYVLAELGGMYSGITAKYGYEKLGSDGTHPALQTPLATLHAFNGWADMFLSTPVMGLIDQSFTVAAKPMGIPVSVVYHDFKADQGSTKYGKEWDAVASYSWDKKYTLGLKYADFSSDSAPTYVDTKKTWLWGEMKF